ncbi:hypothetical protein CYK73_00860 [Clostridium perfringens]|uniref:phage tail spike protein n=1 Tax=Clostridium perfringens TaxID=1502 RepID=UPI000D71CCB4|nr:phage tail spike protein [Clostridium perfringens]PWX04566.1 hypothetical protein CYK73_00860 [Clostridium perfringens]
MIELRDKDKNRVAGLVDYEILCIESVLESGDKTLSFYYPKKGKYYDEIVEEAYIRTKKDEFVVKARELDEDYTKFECSLNLEELEGNIFDRFESVEQTITSALNLAVVGTGWTVKDNTLKKRRTVRCTNKSSLEIVREIKKIYRVDIVFNTLGKQIEVYEHLGEDKGTYFIDSLNLIALQVQSDSRQYATRIIAEGKDGLSFSDINNGKNYVENYQYSNKVKTIYWKDERYTIKENLLEDARAKLEELSKPFRSYSASILNLAELNPRYSSILDFKLGDAINLISKKNKIKDKQRIVKTIEYPQDHSRDTVKLANATLKFEDIQQENQETTDTVNNITTDNGTVDGSTIDSIQVKQIEDFKANVIEVVNLKAINASIDNLQANKADIQDLHAVNAKIGTLEATKANITQLNAVSAEISKLDTLKANIVDLNSATAKIGVLEAKTASIDNLLSQKASINDLNALNATISEALIKKATIAQLEALETKTNNLIADKANIKDLNVTNANINKIQAETASIKTLLNGNLSSENIQAGGITSDKLTIANGFITNLMISSVSASKITAGTIDAAKINVVNLNADNLTVGKINGQLLKDGSISGLAIENGAIDNNKVSPNANIEASKINISSVVTAINEGSTLLTANKVTIDSEKGTLDVAFNNLNTSLEVNKKITESNSTAINVVQGKLSASIENSKVLEGKQKTLEDNYNRTVVTVDSLKNTVGQQKTLIDSATGNKPELYITSNNIGEHWWTMFKLEEGNKPSDWSPAPEDTTSLVEDSIRVIDTKISDVSSSVTQLRDSVTTQINSINSKTHSIETNLGGKASKQEVTEVNNRVTTIKASLDGITQRVSATESKTQTLESNLNGKASKQEVSNISSKVVSLETNLNGITNRVSNTESRINTLDGKVASAVTNQQFTEFKQSNDKFKFTVEQRSSVSNILPNGSFFGGDRGWLHNGSEFWAGAYSGYGFKGRITGAIKNRAAYNNPERYLQTHKAYKVKKNTTYTINFHYICEKNVQSMDAFVVLSNTEYGDYAQPLCILTAQGGSQSNAAEEKPFTYKFNTGNHEWVWLRFDHNGMKSGVNWDEFCWIYVSEVGIYEGDVGAVKWIPKGGEVYSANYQMDGLGFKGTFEDGTYASLGKDGLEWYNAGTGHAYHALTYVTSFDIPVGNPGKAYIKLPAEFTKRKKSLKWTVALRGYYYSTSGDFFPFHVHCTGVRDYIENGLVVCEVQGYCKIQNAQNSGDVQFRPLTAMLIAIA